MKILVCGDRRWKNTIKIKETLRYIKLLWPTAMIIEGNALGADRMARSWAEYYNLEHKTFPAERKKYGRAADLIRNRKMLDEQPNLVVAFHNQIHLSKGAKDCVNEATRRGVPVLVLTEQDEINVRIFDPYTLKERGG